MRIEEIVQQLLQEEIPHLRQLTRECGSCRRFVRRLRRTPRLQVGWDDIPRELLERFSSRLHQRLFQY